MSQMLITGVMELTGGHLLRMLLNESRVNAITALTYQPLADTVGIYNPHDPQLTDAPVKITDPVDVVFCCLGTIRREAGSKEVSIHVDYMPVIGIAPTERRLSAQHMLVMSSMGVNANSPSFYNRVKGEMEQALIAQNWSRLTIVRPSMPLGDRDEQRTNEMFLASLFRLLLGNWKLIEARDIAWVMLVEVLAPGHEGVSVLTSSELRERAK